jgi:tetratricopeptide (TPR) repeat protein
MIGKILRALTTLALLAGFVLVMPLAGQYREYFFHGKVVDTDKKPLAGVEIKLQDENTSRKFEITTNKDGEYKFAGLPHGTYRVSFKKEGFAAKEDEWKFEQSQDRMQKVEIPDVTLVSQALVEKTEQLKNMEAEIKSAAEKLRAKDFDGAVAQLQAFLAKNPKDPNALYYLGIAYTRKGLYPEAVACLTQVVDLVPKFPPAYFELGVAYQRQGEREKALAAYQKNVELDGANPDSAYNAGLILFELSRIDEAKVYLDKANTLRPNDPDILDVMGRCAINAGEFAKAVEYLEKAKALVTDPEKIKFYDDLIAKAKEQIK